MIEYGFTEGLDFYSFLNESTGGRPSTDHQLTIDMAKELCMLQRTEKGKEARQYFIELEKKWNSPESIMSRALQFAQKQLEGLTLQLTMKDQVIKELKPKADYTDSILKNKGLVTITQIAKDYGMSGFEMNAILHEQGVQYKQSEQWLLYTKYQDKGYTHSETINIVRKDGRPDITMNTKWTQKGRLFIYALLKKSGILPVIEQKPA
jgi:anti-repressor protein